MTFKHNLVPSRNEMVFFEEIATDDTADSSTATAEDSTDTGADAADVTSQDADTGATGSEADTNTSDDDEGKKPVPYSRFKEVNDSLKEMKAQIADLTDISKQVNKADAKADDAATDDTGLSKEGREILEKNGFLTKEALDKQLASERAAIAAEAQVKEDVADLTSWAKKEGLPDFKPAEVLKWADENFGKGAIHTKAAFKSAYEAMNAEAIDEARTKRILAEAGKPKAAAEKPGGGGKAEAPTAQKGDIKSRTTAVLDRLEREGKI